MENKYRKYLMVFEQDKKWGFYINNLGRTVIEQHKNYPSNDHPDSYVFTWEKGRVLNEFHLILITKGSGVFESKETGKVKLFDGDVILIFPNVWHRYKPSKNTGWTERWVGFSGKLAEEFLSNGVFSPQEPIISKCNKPIILNHFNTLFKLYDEEPFGFQRIASGLCIQLMAELYNIKQAGSNLDHLNSMVTRAKGFMYKNIKKNYRVMSDLKNEVFLY